MKFGLWMGTYNIGYKINYGKLHHINMFIKVFFLGMGAAVSTIFNLHIKCIEAILHFLGTLFVYVCSWLAGAMRKFYGL